MILRSFVDYKQIIEFFPSKNKYRKCDNSSDNLKCDGNFMILEGIKVFFYRDKERLCLNIDFTEFEIRNSCFVKLNKHTETGTEFNLFEGNDKVVTINYQFNRNDFLFDDEPSGFVEEEDFNYGLFLKNVISSIERRNQVFRH